MTWRRRAWGENRSALNKIAPKPGPLDEVELSLVGRAVRVRVRGGERNTQRERRERTRETEREEWGKKECGIRSVTEKLREYSRVGLREKNSGEKEEGDRKCM